MEQNKIFREPYNREPSGGVRRCVTRETILCEQYIEFLKYFRDSRCYRFSTVISKLISAMMDIA